MDTINSLRLKGLDNGTFYREVAQSYDLCFTKDAGFVRNVRQMREPSKTKLLCVTLPQQPAQSFVSAFVLEFQRADWNRYENGNDWP